MYTEIYLSFEDIFPFINKDSDMDFRICIESISDNSLCKLCKILSCFVNTMEIRNYHDIISETQDLGDFPYRDIENSTLNGYESDSESPLTPVYFETDALLINI